MNKQPYIIPLKAFSYQSIFQRLTFGQMFAMDIRNSSNLYMMLMYVYMKAYREALEDFEYAVKDSSYVDLALLSVKQKYCEKIDRIANEMSI